MRIGTWWWWRGWSLHSDRIRATKRTSRLASLLFPSFTLSSLCRHRADSDCKRTRWSEMHLWHPMYPTQFERHSSKHFANRRRMFNSGQFYSLACSLARSSACVRNITAVYRQIRKSRSSPMAGDLFLHRGRTLRECLSRATEKKEKENKVVYLQTSR